MPQEIKCPACGNSRTSKLNSHKTEEIYRGYRLPGREVVSALKALHSVNEYDLIKCLDCGLEFAQPLSAPSSDWYGVLYKNLALYPGARWEYAFVLKKTTLGSSICDLGCGSGEFLKLAKKNGFVATGVDFSLDAVEKGKANGLEMHHFQIGNLQNRATKKYDTLVSFQVLEHLESPGDLFKVAETLGKSDCKLWISVPSDLRPSRIYSEIDYLDLPPHHMTHWTKEAMKSLGVRNGWTLRNVYYEPISFKQIIWNRTVRSRLYGFWGVMLKNHKWLERFLRALLFVPIGIQVIVTKQKISGFSMLALFERNGDA